jgi:3-oxoacyl-[acyl-carrier-protein] synthase-3|tara:strand:+ start:56 stop:1057 length:1002 start_codon:yes stop_codon:yes gene_type:complete
MKPKLRNANITAVGKYLPKNILTNADLEKMVDTNDEWIQSRTGIQERRIVDKGEASVEMSINAIQQILDSRNLDPTEIDAIIVGTVTPDMLFPSCAALIQHRIGATNAWGYDLSAACSGFIFALQSGSALIESGQCEKVLIVGVDTMSSILDYEDRDTCILFGDGAGAVLLEPSEEYGIIDGVMRVDGGGGEFLKMPGGGSLHRTSHETVEKKMHYIQQDGRTVYKFAVKGMADVSYELASRNNLTNDDIDLFIPHQANKRIIDAAAKRLGLPNEKVLINISKYANTTAGTIPIAIAEAVETKRLKKGDNLILASFGAGFTWGATYIKWGMDS